MRRYQQRLLHSATDLNVFLGCRHASALARRAVDGEKLAADTADPILDLLQRRGIQHEAAFLAELTAKRLNVVSIPDGPDLATRVGATVQAMRARASVIYQAALAHGRWHGFADFLQRVEFPSGLGDWCYEIVDTKLAARAKASHAIQLALYADLVEAVQGIPPPTLRVRLGNGQEEVLRPGDVVHYTRLAGQRLETFMDLPSRNTAAEPSAYCSLCGWADRCKTEWEAADHLSLVTNISRSQIRKLRAANVETLAGLAAAADTATIPGLSPGTFARLQAQAQLQFKARIDGQRCLEVLPALPRRGFARLPEPDRGDVFFDMEGDPLFPDGGLEYLFGAHVAGEAFRAFWGHSRAGEKRALEDLIDFLVGQVAKHPGAHVYHYNHYEPTALKRLAMRHGTREAALDDLLRGQRFVDLYKVVREQLRTSEPGLSLKNVERFFRGEREGEVGTAADSIVAYEQYCETGDAKILADIVAYNEIDCVSTAGLHDWLLTMRPAGSHWFAPTGEGPDEATLKRWAEAETERAKTTASLLTGAPPGETAYRTLVAELCEFHRREQKQQWWAMFDRMERDDDELVADADCLGGLCADGPAVEEKRSWKRAYTFPIQDTKLRFGDTPTIAATMKPAGTIVSFDPDGGRLELKRSKSGGDMPDALSLGPAKPRDDTVLRGAVRRFADSVALGDRRFRAIKSILRRDLRRIAKLPQGASILDPGQDTVAGAVSAAAKLDESYLFIQGPPGTGKTYTASRMAVALMQKGQRVGISSNSHKAINNLLKAIETAAKDADFTFTGIKKATAGEPEQAFDGSFITTVTDNAAVDLAAQLIAGTAWLFARKEQEEAIDTLFVDEAGQISLANLVAIGTAARNIVLVGDQQQLGQPIQGMHPEGTGVSVLEHLLEQTATVRRQMGIFLDVSFRMHPSLCQWVSQTFYEGRLRAHPSLDNQALLLPPGAPAPLAAHGLRFLPVEHADRSQSCPEEADAVEMLWHTLMGQGWIDRHGTNRTIGPEDVLVVAPYNVQVNLLRRRLPDGARVGTVDKFQGQEAAVVLVSMTTSSGEDLPRNIGFLFSHNRLNVAVSRAKCLTVLVASPRLLETSCGKVEDLVLVNALCSAAAFSKTDGCGGEAASEPSWRKAETDWPLPLLMQPLPS